MSVVSNFAIFKQQTWATSHTIQGLSVKTERKYKFANIGKYLSSWRASYSKIHKNLRIFYRIVQVLNTNNANNCQTTCDYLQFIIFL